MPGLKTLYQDQLEAIQILLKDKRTRIPILTIWGLSFGGAIHSPIASYFFLGVGATDVQIGTLGSIATIGSLFLSPIYGIAQDRYGSFVVMCASCLFCAIGCFVRGMANHVNWLYLGSLILGLGGSLGTISLSFILQSFISPSKQALIVSGYIGQQRLFELLGKLCYPLLDEILLFSGIVVEMHRFRIVMSMCTLVCFSGFVSFLLKRHDLTAKQTMTYEQLPTFETQDHHADTMETADNVEMKDICTDSNKVAPNVESEESNLEDTAKSKYGNGREQPLQMNGNLSIDSEKETEVGSMHQSVIHQKSKFVFILLSLALVIQSMTLTATTVIWPLYLLDRFSIHPHSYMWLLLAKSVLSIISISAYSPCQRHTVNGIYRAPMLSLSVAAITGFVGFTIKAFNSSELIELSRHVLFSLICFGALSFTEPAIKSLATTFIPQKWHGFSWGVISTLQGCGVVLGNTVGTILYHNAKEDSKLVDDSPFLMLSISLATGTVLVFIAERLTSHQLVDFENYTP